MDLLPVKPGDGSGGQNARAFGDVVVALTLERGFQDQPLHHVHDTVGALVVVNAGGLAGAEADDDDFEVVVAIDTPPLVFFLRKLHRKRVRGNVLSGDLAQLRQRQVTLPPAPTLRYEVRLKKHRNTPPETGIPRPASGRLFSSRPEAKRIVNGDAGGGRREVRCQVSRRALKVLLADEPHTDAAGRPAGP